MYFNSVLFRGLLAIDGYMHTSIYNSLIKAVQLALLKDRSDNIELFVNIISRKTLLILSRSMPVSQVRS